MARGSLKVHCWLLLLKAFLFPIGMDGEALSFHLVPFVHNGSPSGAAKAFTKTMTTMVEIYTLMLLRLGSEGEEVL
jgi:hypothetical protein